MATSGNTTFAWELWCSPPGGVGSPVIFKSGGLHKTRPSSWKLDQKEDISASSLEIRFPDATHFFNMWNDYNPLTVGTKVVLKVDGFTRFTGKVYDFMPHFSAADRSVTIICRDRMGALKDAVVDIDIRRDTSREKINLIRKNPLSSIFLSVINVTPAETGAITVFAISPAGADITRVTSAGHALSDNEIVKITGTTNYDGIYSIQYVDANNFDIALTFVLNDATGNWTRVGWIRPWAEEYIVPVWIGDPNNPVSGAKRVLLSEYEMLYEIGGIAFNESTVRTIGQIDNDEQLLNAIEDVIYADIIYYDTSDDSTMISNLMRLVFGQSVATGGLGWTEGVEYQITDETTGDILSGMEWNTQEGDGDAISFIANLYDDPRIGLAPSYWMRDFNGNGQVNLKLIAQDNNNAIDVDIILDAQLPNPFSSIYSRAVLVNNSSTRRNLMRDAVITDLMPQTIINTPLPWGNVIGVTETGNHPSSSAIGPENLQDGTSATSWGYFSVGGKSTYDLDMVLPFDKPLAQIDLSPVNKVAETIDSIYMKALFTFEGGDESQPYLHDTNTGEDAANGMYKVHEPMRHTIEYNTDIGDVPNVNSWYTISPDLYNVEMDIVQGDAWIKVEGINQKARWIRIVVNNPAFVKVAESNWSAQAYRALLWFSSEIIVLGLGRVQDVDGHLPSVQFTDNPADPLRCLYDIYDNLVDMYRPKLLAFLEACGLKFKTLVIEAEDIWDFITKKGDPEDVGFGYKYLVSKLDAASKENEWTVMIDPRPDIRIGHTVYSSKLDPDKKYLVMGSSLQMVGGKMIHTLELTDVNTVDGDEPTGYCA